LFAPTFAVDPLPVRNTVLLGASLHSFVGLFPPRCGPRRYSFSYPRIRMRYTCLFQRPRQGASFTQNISLFRGEFARGGLVENPGCSFPRRTPFFVRSPPSRLTKNLTEIRFPFGKVFSLLFPRSLLFVAPPPRVIGFFVGFNAPAAC